nr:serine hydrolase [Chroococcus sp. FPU101]
MLHRLRYLPTGNNFRSHYAYTNFGFTEAAVAAAKSTGTLWEDLCFKTLYQPLGMNNTSSRYSDFIAANNRASGHIYFKGQWVAQEQRTPDAQSPAGGVSSSVHDMAQWMRLQLGKGIFDGLQIINAEALAETHRPQMISNPPQNPSIDRAEFYGLGWGIKYTDEGLVRLSHSGAFNLGAATTVYLLPSEKLGIVVLTNSRPIGVPETIALSFLDLVQYGQIKRDYLKLLQSAFAALDQPPYGTLIDYTKPLTQPLPALSYNSYIGTYQNDYFGEIEIVERDGKLILLQGAQKKAFPLQHYNRDVFTYQPEGENAFGLSAVTFTVGADGKGTNVIIENLNILEQGTFHRLLPQK